MCSKNRIYFTVNGEKYSAGSEVDSDTSVLFYLRNKLNLRGVKYMCREGGCGACVVTATAPTAEGEKKTFSINSCLVSITSCENWDITTPEGLGSRYKGYHAVQKALADHNGTQCGFCSPGWTMAMYGLLEANNYNLSQLEIERGFASNLCRCTGYRPILDAFKTFANDAPQPNDIADIEDIRICSKKGNCTKTNENCKSDCKTNENHSEVNDEHDNDSDTTKKKVSEEYTASEFISKKDVSENELNYEILNKVDNELSSDTDIVNEEYTSSEYISEKDVSENELKYETLNKVDNELGTDIDISKIRVSEEYTASGFISEKDVSENELKDMEWVFVSEKDTEEVKRIVLKDKRVWYRVNEIKEIFDVLKKEKTDDYMLVAGNTARGAYHIFAFPQLLIDISGVFELKKYYFDQNLYVGAGVTLTDLMTLFKGVSQEREEFRYLYKLYEHLALVAHIPVRNIGTWAGNLMIKHKVNDFSSDVFLLFETIGATITITDYNTNIEVTPESFLNVDMRGKLILKVAIPPLADHNRFSSLKIMPRSQNAHAQVNAGFLYNIAQDGATVQSARIVFGGISSSFVHARKTEDYLRGKNLFTNTVLQNALKILQKELKVEEIRGELSPEFRKKLALGLFYKGLLQIAPIEILDPRFLSGRRNFRRTRPLSKGIEVYDTNPIIWPITEPMPKIEALTQCAGEAMYVNDLPTLPREIFCAFVTADVATGQIDNIDPTPALNMPGVITFLSAKDIPGINSMVSRKNLIINREEELLSSGQILYYDQPLGIILAETEDIANRAALIVNVTYKNDKNIPLLTIEDVRNRDPSRVTLLVSSEAKRKGADIYRFINGSTRIFAQYPFTMESQSCVTMPNENGIGVWSASQWLDCVQLAIVDALKVKQNRLQNYWTDLKNCFTIPKPIEADIIPDEYRLLFTAGKCLIPTGRVAVTVPRCGGAYGFKVTRNNFAAVGAALGTHLLGRPARFIMSIQSMTRCLGKRLPCTRDFEMLNAAERGGRKWNATEALHFREVAVNKDGVIQHLDYNLYDDNGCILNEALLNLATPSLKNCYNRDTWRYSLFNVTTDTASNSWIRSPGSLEGIAMTEYVMEQIAYELDKDPLEVRLNNLDTTLTDIVDTISTLIKDSDYHIRKEQVKEFNRKNRWKKRGIRVALMSWPFPLVTDYHVLMSVFHGDATVLIKHGGIECGQGVNTKVIQATAYTLNISMDKIRTDYEDSMSNPNGFSTAGSRATQSVIFGVLKCCQLLLNRLEPIRKNMSNATWEEVIAAAYLAGINLQVSYRVTANDQQIYRVAGAAVAEVELDILTGEHEILRVDIEEDVGTSVNPEIDIGQIEGAFIMGLGYWTSENIIYDRKSGELLTDRTWNYYIPMSNDIPIDFRVKLRRNSYNPLGTLGARAVAEPATCMAIVVGFAIRHAITASREETGYPRTKWFNVDGPYTLQQNVLKSDVRLEEFKYA